MILELDPAESNYLLIDTMRIAQSNKLFCVVLFWKQQIFSTLFCS